MDGAGRLARSLRSPRPPADLKAAAIGAVVLLRERLGLRPRTKSAIEREPPHRWIAVLERYLPRRIGVTATILMLLGSAGLGDTDAAREIAFEHCDPAMRRLAFD